MRSALNRNRGLAIVSAIFILVVLAALGAFAVSVSTSQQTGSALDVQGVRAYQAARAGIEWGLYRQLRAGSCVAAASFTPAPAATSFTGFTVTVNCAATVDPSGGPTVYSVVATACNQPSGGACPNTTSVAATSLYVERRLDVSF